MFNKIDWEQQWACHAFDFREGKAHIPLPRKGQISLCPGFGDYSHPTTRLMIEMMERHVPNQVIFDIGCGSGILSIAAAKMGAQKIHICDIDPLAIEHAHKNGELNGVRLHEERPLSKPIILMNMIASEQKIAWNNNKLAYKKLITSGILKEQKEDYFSFAQDNGWQLQDILESEGWLSCLFKENK